MVYENFLIKTDYNEFDFDFKEMERKVLALFPLLERFKYESVRTPVRQVVSGSSGPAIYAKMENESVSGSVKGRTAYCLIIKAIAFSSYTKDFHLLEYSGGNLAIALSKICKALNINNTLVVSSALPMSEFTKLQLNGSDVVLVQSERGFWGVMEEAFRIHEEHPEYLFTYQHQERLNTAFHQATTAQEVIDDLSLDHSTPIKFVASAGTGGTFAGFYNALSSSNVPCEYWLNMPEELKYKDPRPPNSSPKFGGSGGLGCGRGQPLLVDIPITGQHTVSYSEAMAAKRAYFELTGDLIGSSAAANWLTSLKIASDCEPDDTASKILTVFPCGGTREENESALGKEYDLAYQDILNKFEIKVLESNY
ncbi:TPA: pyridoxal-phosphate dependent enzyme [Vibrio cholerae]|nr:pyridoxal-phosphate dependent enzyme [Vibrio cholerae]